MIYSANSKSTPQYISSTSKIDDSIVNQGAVIYEEVTHCVISKEVEIEKGAVVKNSFLLPWI